MYTLESRAKFIPLSCKSCDINDTSIIRTESVSIINVCWEIELERRR